MNELKLEKVDVTKQLDVVLEVRKKVFIDEQNVPLEEEIDEFDIINDDKVIHFALYSDEICIGTIRIINTENYIKIGRVAILKDYRNKGYGKYMIENMLKFIENNDIFKSKNKYYYLEAQLHALNFYQSLGFKEYGDVFLDAGIEHKKMKNNM